MADGNWAQVRKIFDEALRQKPEERQKFVRRSCGKNKTLLAEVESLLESLDSADSFLEKPAVAKVAGRILSESQQFTGGHFLNHYQIIKQIGIGGMGQVYLAQDTKLNRKVALKILRENMLVNKQANHRLLREAQAAALLEHPNICAIYEISESDEISFIVMQYVEGKTLAELLANKALTVEKSLDLAIQIADALTEAHSHGIIHRDIKPANIILNEKGQAKVLDFGLAKFIEAEIDDKTSKRFNSSGAVMGTVPYMSPEQLCGKRLDARTDIFSFGALFYEMLAGKSAFAGESNAETISAILNDQPDLTEIPPVLQLILSKCLMKKSLERYQTAQELLKDLLEAKQSNEVLIEKKREKSAPTTRFKQNSSQKNVRFVSKSPLLYFWKGSEKNSQRTPETTRIGSEQTVETKTLRFNLATVLVSLVMAFLTIGAGFLIYREFYKTDDLHSFDNLQSVRLLAWKTAASSIYSDYRISHDGKMVAYSSTQDGPPEGIFVKQTIDGTEIRVTKDEWTNVTPIWSPDDQRIAFSSERDGQTGIYSIPAFGGVAVRLITLGENRNIYLRHWSNDGGEIFYELDGNLFRLDITTQEVNQLTNFTPSKSDRRYFNISPDETEIVYVNQMDGQSDLWMSAIKDGSPVRLTNDKDEEIQPRWHADGKRILYTVHRNNYFQINIAYVDGRTPSQVTRGESDYRLIDISGDGTKIYYLSREKKSNIWGVKTDTGEELETVSGADSEFWADVSPDGTKIVYQSYLIEQTIHLAPNPSNIVRSPTNQLSPFSVKGWNPRWLPDNRRIAFLRREEKEQKSNLWLVDIISGEEKQITNTSVTPPSYSFLPINRSQTREYSFSPDSRQVVYLAKEAGFGNILKTSTESGETINLTNNTNPNLFYYSPQCSPDGKRIAFISQQKPASKGEKAIWKIWTVGTDHPKEIYSTGANLRLLGWTAAGELVLEQSDTLITATPLDISLLRISAAGEKQFETGLKNIYVTSMSLSADGKMVVFTARQNDKDNLFVASTNSGEIKKVTANGNSRLFYGSPILSPDGKAIFFGKQEETNTISRLENFK